MLEDFGQAFGSMFMPKPYQQTGGLSNDQIKAFAEQMRTQGMGGIEHARRQGMGNVAATAAGGGVSGSGLQERGYRKVSDTAGQAASQLEGQIAQAILQAYAQQQFAPPQPGIMESLLPGLVGIGANLAVPGITGLMAPAQTAAQKWMGGQGGYPAQQPQGYSDPYGVKSWNSRVPPR
jgi:hypothetical protein